MTPKQKAWQACSKYVRLRDALEFCKRMRIDTTNIQIEELPVKCVSCPKIAGWKYGMHAGHYYSRGSGGKSGVYFDERNSHAQCPSCNSFRQGNAQPYREFMFRTYTPEVLEELERLHRLGKKYAVGEFEAIEKMYLDMFEELAK